MRYLNVPALSCVALLAASCAGQPAPDGSPSFVQQVQSAAVSACGFLPQAQSVGNLIQANPTQMQQAATLANAVCNALANTALPRTAPGTPVTLRVSNVPVEGTLVR